MCLNSKYSAIFTAMKKTSLFSFFILIGNILYSQEEQRPFSIEADYFYGSILEHNPDIGHLITAHPEGFVLKYNFKTYGFKEWERRYNYPDWGFSFLYHGTKNETLGDLYGIYSHLSWYFLNRNLRLSVGQGIAYATNPYDADNNYRNNAYGSHLLSSTYLQGAFIKENIWNGIGMYAGITLVHYSNGNIKPPNTSTNTLGFTLGVNYLIDAENFPEYIASEEVERHTEPIRYNAVFRFGVTGSDVIGLGAEPFYIFSAYADKTLSRKSNVQLGAEVFFSTFLKEYINYRSIAYPEDNLSGDEDYKRVGVFAGYEMRFNKISAFVNLGFYAYYPYDFEGRMYNRLGLKRSFGKNENIFVLVDVRSHAAKAEAFELGIGYRF